MSVETERECLAALRIELAESYPSIRTDRLVSIARTFGMDRFPAGFLISGDLHGSGPHSARTLLGDIHRSADGTEIDAHPLFSQAFYTLMNPDVAGAGIPPWLHYQVHGRSEGRSPHPLIDTAFLASWLPGVARQHVVDSYLGDPDFWLADTGPYVDCRRFVVEGPWDGVTNPLLQIVRNRLTSPWVHSRLQLIDTDSPSEETARLTGAAYLLGRAGTRNVLAAIDTWALPAEDGILPSEPTTFTVIPGSFVGAAEMVLWSAHRPVVSPDSSAVRLPTEILSLRSGDSVSAATLVVLQSELDRSRLTEILATLPPGSAVAPYSQPQQESLEAIVPVHAADVRVLQFGRQLHVTGATIRLEPAANPPLFELWRSPEPADGPRTALVITDDEVEAHLSNVAIRGMIDAGAMLCVLGNSGLSPWQSALDERDLIVCRPSLARVVATFVPATSIRLFTADPTEGHS